MEAFNDVIRRVVEAFEGARLDYMFTGALAASFYGVPRTTTDIDIVISVSREEAHVKLAEVLRNAELSFDDKKMDAVFESDHRIVTVRDNKTPYSVDIILSRKKLEKRAGTILGLATFYQTPEDLISAKLRMIKATIPKERALKDINDIKAILKFTKVDVDTVRKKAWKNKTLSIFKEITTDKFG
ncbi:MAG: nucleotidyl transferase AbiEii/AbiGii toxin family protein [Candidatus Bathyarchaeia archaeon]